MDPFQNRGREQALAMQPAMPGGMTSGMDAAHPAALASADAAHPQAALPTSPVRLASAEVPDQGAAAQGSLTEIPVPDMEVLGDHTVDQAPLEFAGSPHACWCAACALPQFKLPPSDEVLCDGGDDGLPAVVVRDGTVVGLEIEDTVAHYRTPDGQTIIQPTNEVCLYAPRFGSVRLISGASVNIARRGAEGFATDLSPVGAEGNREASTALQKQQPLAGISDRPPSLLRTRQLGSGLENDQRISRASSSEAARTALHALRFVLIDNRVQPLEVGGMVNAIHWTHDLGVQVAIGTKKAQVVAGDRQAALLYRFEESPEPALRICKLADRSAAKSGDVVRFALQYENVGNRPLTALTIVDNLTTRLAYIEGSQVSDRPAEFSAEANDGGSLILRWALSQPLEPGQRGLIQFDCRVR
jgi:uncharacterized repeat protein (TIGR01451 family)